LAAILLSFSRHKDFKRQLRLKFKVATER